MLQLIQQLEDKEPERRGNAGEDVVASARVAPELFSDLGLRVLAEYFDDGMIGPHALETVRLVLRHRPDHPLADELVSAALGALKRNWFVDDEVSLLIAERAEHAGVDTVRELIPLIVEHLYYSRSTIMGGFEPRLDDGKALALARVGRLEPALVAGHLNELLHRPDPHKRIAAARFIEAFLDQVQELAEHCLTTLIDSLDLEDLDMCQRPVGAERRRP